MYNHIISLSSLDYILDYGIFSPSRKTSLAKNDYQYLVDRQDPELRNSWLTDKHITCQGQDRQNVRMAVQFFTDRQKIRMNIMNI